MAETTTQTIADFLLARIAEDEMAAVIAGAAPPKWGMTVYPHNGDSIPLTDETMRAFLPTHVKAECVAKRRIVENYANLTAAAERDRLPDETEYDVTAIVWHAQGLHEAVSDLAQVYADHPDFREEWRA